eukprot:gene11712-8059_t
MSCSWTCCKGDDVRTPPRENARAGDRENPRSDVAPAVAASNTAGGISNLEDFLKSTLAEAERFILELSDPQPTKQAIAVTFLNSIAELARNKWKLTFAVVKETMTKTIQKSKLALFSECVSMTQEQYMDDGFTRLLAAWRSHNPNGKKKVSPIEIQAVLAALYIHLDVPPKDHYTFYDIMLFHFRWIACNTAALEVFTKFSQGKETMSADQLACFLRETQHLEVTDRQIMDKLTYRYGGVIHRYNFACYNGSVLTNCAIDPARTSDVWQDMTQSFTRYVMCCARVDSPSSLYRALGQEQVRAIILPELKKETEAMEEGITGDSVVCGSCTLGEIIAAIKKQGFVNNTYPIALCLPPASAIPKDLQGPIARLLADGFGAMLGKGLMLEGSVITDPKFSPGALRKKVLIMGSQSPLRPFVGFLVADMNKDGLGVRVTDVVEGTPAAKGGVSKDDWLTHVNGQPIPNKQRLRELLNSLKVGSEISIKRENMEEMKIIVGGVVDPTNTTVAQELSNIVFFKYAEDPNPKPWDTNIITKKQLLDPALKRTKFEDHFAIATINGPDTDPTVKNGDLLGAATRLGIQFIDIDNSERCLAWSRGRFTDNGRCGYLLKTSSENEHPRNVTIEIIVGPRAIGNPPLRQGTVELFGPGAAKLVGSSVVFTGCTESSICAVKLFFDTEVQEAGFIASFSPALCRTGFRGDAHM